MVSKRRTWAPAAAGGLLVAVLIGSVLALASSPRRQACAGQCGPPFQLQVNFRPGTTTRAATAALSGCAANPLVVRIGRVDHSRGPAGPPRSLTATIYTSSMRATTRNDHLLRCLRRSPSVISAGYPD